MGKYVTAKTSEIAPSQDFLKPGTVRHILHCFETNELAELPPTPFVRRNPDPVGLKYVAIDGHNLIAVYDHRDEEIKVYVAEDPEDGIASSQPGVTERNQDLRDKFESAAVEAKRLSVDGLASFAQLMASYPELFA